ncbi:MULTISPECIES: MipA/OmpV family protein [Paraburkholderia]|uniref:Outer membrane scaffolding protein for murein synthesis, MipA/OmpV family n=1 Tax=Paraburkholderia megapolitana TaxID=420953 RepID=A0A1I3L653_9BURK|nr:MULTISPECIES: MipA/OmpV family protein [Paraburkholderia]MCX4163307.1 MipA/OmpV family protein [Paraburkholderia megapolitana]MDN7158802.1 MipA/OmpV family protein [Paraburkholderia sp. CHISQ3]MDQ6495849.1 MipA/OmpV family protein [Paraburkholderia megapolitana]QDQ80576.1 MipA/OmpV family protein [Paraburkholderia megapolitana]SFI80110.1 Outer membrane scaffolding protein for murein synthesis, MipA/OmpV family [Paraburkholderia megapolitana]
MKLRSAFYLVLALAGFAVSSAAFADGYDVTVGAGVDLAPRYLGSNEYHFTPIPYLNVVTPVGIYIDTTRGVGYTLNLPHNFYIDASLNYAIGRKDSNESFGSGSDTLRGMGDVPNALITSLTAGYRFANVGSVSVGADIPLSNRSIGDSYRVAVEVPLMVTASDVLTTKAVAHIGSSDYNQTMFGVTGSQSAASGIRKYSVGGGFNAVDVGLTWTHMFNKHWSVSTSGVLTRFVGDSADSPIVQGRVSANLATIASYKF